MGYNNRSNHLFDSHATYFLHMRPRHDNFGALQDQVDFVAAACKSNRLTCCGLHSRQWVADSDSK